MAEHCPFWDAEADAVGQYIGQRVSQGRTGQAHEHGKREDVGDAVDVLVVIA